MVANWVSLNQSCWKTKKRICKLLATGNPMFKRNHIPQNYLDGAHDILHKVRCVWRPHHAECTKAWAMPLAITDQCPWLVLTMPHRGHGNHVPCVWSTRALPMVHTWHADRKHLPCLWVLPSSRNTDSTPLFADRLRFITIY